MTADPVDIGGRLRLQPGRQPALASTRRDWLPRLAAGQPAAALPGLVATLFSLCGHAHRWAAEAAIRVAAGQAPRLDDAARQAHRAATLKDQLMRLHGDWPRWLPGVTMGPDLTPMLRRCPLWQTDRTPADAMADMPAWLTAVVLGQAPARWLADHASDPVDQPWHWAARGDTALARLLDRQRATRALPTPGVSLALLHDPAVTLSEPAARMTQPGFVMRPVWHGAPADTGPWSRQAGALPAASAGDRLMARLVEVVRLAVPGGEHGLTMGACALGPNEGVAWIEMARGLLLHRVRLHDAPGAPRVADARVLAPTEWNLHPDGALARALQRLDPGDAVAAARLAVAFDPCVPFDVEPPARADNRPIVDTRRKEWPCTS